MIDLFDLFFAGFMKKLTLAIVVIIVVLITWMYSNINGHIRLFESLRIGCFRLYNKESTAVHRTF